MEIESIKTMKFEKGDTLVVKLPPSNMPPHRVMAWGNDIRAAIQKLFPDNTILVLCNGIELEVLKKEVVE